jgi:hypothetical protein
LQLRKKTVHAKTLVVKYQHAKLSLRCDSLFNVTEDSSISFQFNSIEVSRRFKHFIWIHDRLVENFPLIPIPPLPVKQVQGKLLLFTSSGNNLNFFVKEKITTRLMNSFNNCLGKPFVALKLKYLPIFFFLFVSHKAQKV